MDIYSLNTLPPTHKPTPLTDWAHARTQSILVVTTIVVFIRLLSPIHPFCGNKYWWQDYWRVLLPASQRVMQSPSLVHVHVTVWYHIQKSRGLLLWWLCQATGLKCSECGCSSNRWPTTTMGLLITGWLTGLTMELDEGIKRQDGDDRWEDISNHSLYCMSFGAWEIGRWGFNRVYGHRRTKFCFSKKIGLLF